jgi:hypothetical protein
MVIKDCKSAVIGRKKVGEDSYNCLINLFDINDPHMTKEVPKECLEFENIDHVHIDNLKIKFCLLGNDLVLNDLKNINVEQNEEQKSLHITGEQ